MSNAPCFYPNGNPSLEEDIPCGTGSAVGCCPLNWVCQPNGLCYLQNENYYGRYTCTDKGWGSGCPDICTYNNTAKGNEAVLECTAGSYCCDTNRPELSGGTDCCDASPSRFSIIDLAEVPSTFKSSIPSSSSVLPTSAPPSLTSVPTSSTTAAAPTSLACDSDRGETSCGPICCALEQYCAYVGQCVINSITLESDSSTPTFGNAATTTATSSSKFVPTATEHTSMTSPLQHPSPALSSAVSSSTLSTSGFIAVTTAITVAVTPTAVPTLSTTAVTTITPTAVPSPGIPHSVGFKAGVSTGSVVVLLVILILLYWRRRRRTQQYEPAKTRDEDPSSTPPSNVALYGSTKPPNPNPYAQRSWPNDGQGSVDSRSRSNFALAPDHDGESSRRRPNLQHAPALNPYNMSPPAAATDTTLGDQEPWQSRSPAPSYRTEDPAVRVQASRSRQHLGQREQGIQEVLGDERFGG